MRPEYEIKLLAMKTPAGSRTRFQQSMLGDYQATRKLIRTNKKKGASGDDDFDYLHGVLTSARDWRFLFFTS
ncbi:hypothetical protein RhiirC2_778291 [Rhizophagus irregularis]|uniref:Uncharacterized protein n=1 Tax=Rhizophagus irregularis TaxID=588596 RepID=A0A2N1NCC7_9GLOM|nr:hypothetical protein RhiirC2_778291 [Rhizophagus irregularis]